MEGLGGRIGIAEYLVRLSSGSCIARANESIDNDPLSIPDSNATFRSRSHIRASVACRLGGPIWSRRRVGEALPSRLVSQTRLPCRMGSDSRFQSFVGATADIARDPCQRHVLLRRVV